MMSLQTWRKFSLLAGAGVLALLTGCAQVKLSPPTASIENTQLARSSITAPVAVADFTSSAQAKSDDKGLSIRSNTFFSPYDSSFAKYLQEALSVELRSAGLLDPASKTVIGGELTKSTVDAGASQGTGALGARFKVTRGGTAVYDKELVENDSWPSSFVGAIAIPDAVNHYTALYRKLVARLLADEAFKAAVKP